MSAASSSSSLQPVRGTVMSNSTEVIESYVWASSSRSFGIYAERLLMNIIRVAQSQVNGANFRDGSDIGQVSVGPLGHATIEIPIRSLTGNGSNNYTKAKKGVMELMEAPYFIERPKIRGGRQVYDELGKPEYEFLGFQILNSCEVNVKPGFAVVEVNSETWKGILDFTKGFRKLDFEVAMKLKGVTSLRMYNLMSNVKKPITFTIAELRRMWGYDAVNPKTGKYEMYDDTNSFIRRLVEPARAELDEKSPMSFDFVTNSSASAEENRGRRGRKSITSITFFPIKKITGMSTQGVLKSIGSASSILGAELYQMLLNKFEFSKPGIENNLVLFETARKAGMDVLGFLDSIAPDAFRANSPQGYVINAVKKSLREKYGVEFQGKSMQLPSVDVGGGD